MDISGNGFVSKNDWDEVVAKVMKWTGIEFNKTYLAEMWNFLDSNGDGRIDHNEFQMGTTDDVSENFLERRVPWPFLPYLIQFITVAYLDLQCCEAGGCGCDPP